VRQELFLHGKVLHMNVDNLVERRARDRANSAKFNTMMRIAQLWCNGREWKSELGKFFAHRDEEHGVAGRKAQNSY
jgi:hypothetical protein